MKTSFVKKAIVVGSSAAMALSSFAFAGTAFAAAHAAGTNVVSNGTVYFIDNNGQLRPYTSAGAFLSYGFNSWSNVVAASAEDMALPRGSFVPPMDGSLINDHGTVYLMTNGQRAGFTSAANFLGLGYSWANVIPGDTSFLTSAPLINTTAMAHPAGTLVNDHGTVYLLTTTGKMGIPSLSVFNSWGYSFSKVAPANSYDSALPMSAGVMNALVPGQLNPTGSNGGVVIPPTTGSVSVSLASDSPAAGTIVAGQAAADLGHFTFYGTGTVTSVNLKRIGVSADSTLTNVYLYNGQTRLTDASSVTSGSNINFTNSNGLFTVNGSTTISVRADIAASTSGQTVGVQLVSASTGSTAVSGTPISASVSTIAQVTTSTATLSSLTPSAATITPANDQVVWQASLTVSPNNALLTRLALKEIGSINTTDVQNFRLYVDGTQVAQVQNMNSNNFITFAPSYSITTGTHTLKVLADVVGGSSRNFSFELQNAADLGLTDTLYNVGIAATGTGIIGTAAGVQTISSGAMTVQKATTSPSSNVTLTSNDTPLADWTLTATGEPIKVTNLLVTIQATTNGNSVTQIRNARLLVNGAQVGNTTNITLGTTATTINTNFTVNPGSPATVELRADINTPSGTNFANNDVLVATLKTGSSNGQGQVSYQTLNVPTADVAGNSVTVQTGTLSLSKNATYGNQTTVVPQTNYHLASFNLTGNTTEDVNVNSLTVAFSTAATFTAADLNNVYVKVGGQTLQAKTTVGASNTYNISFTLPKGTSVPLDVYGDIASGAITAGDSITTTVTAAGTTAQSNTAVTTSATAGQTITYNSGSIAVALDASAPLSKIVAAPQTGMLVGAYKFSATNDTYTISQLTVTFGGTNAATVISNVKLLVNGAAYMLSGAQVSQTLNGSAAAVFTGLGITVPSNSSVVVGVAVDLANVGVGMGASGANIQANLTEYKTQSSTGTVTDNTGLTNTANAIYVYKAIPTVTVTSNNVTPGGTQALATMNVAANGNAISWKDASFTVAVTGSVTEGTFVLKDASQTSVGTCTPGTLTGGAYVVKCVATNEQQIAAGSSASYTLYGTAGGTLTANDRVTVTMPHGSTSFSAPAAEATATTGSTFTWSDLSASPHSLTSTDWNNDYLVQNLQ